MMSNPSNSQIILAVMTGRAEAVEALLAKGADIDGRDSKGFTPLMIAALHGRTEILALLLQHGANVNSQADTGTTALMLAADSGQEEIAKSLLRAGASVNVRDGNRWTGLMMAARKNFVGIVRVLLDQGADVNTRNIDGSTALMYAVEEGHIECVQLLLKRKPDINSPNTAGSNPLGLAADRGFIDILTMLLDAGANVNATNPVDGMTALHFAAQNGFEAMATLLLERGANPEARNRDGTTPIMYALWQGHHAIARTLGQGRAAVTGTTEEEQDAEAIRQVGSDIADVVLSQASEGDQLSDLMSQGTSFAGRGDFKRTIACFERAAQLDPGNAKLWHNIGLAHDKLGHSQEALTAYDRALSLSPSLWQTWNNKGEVLRSVGQYNEALHCYNRALEFNPKDEKSLYNKGVVLNGLMDSVETNAEARRCFVQARELGHPDAEEQLRVIESLMSGAAQPSKRSSTGRHADKNSFAEKVRRSDSKEEVCPRCHAPLVGTMIVCKKCGHIPWGMFMGVTVFVSVLVYLSFLTWSRWSQLIPWSPLGLVVRWTAAALGFLFLVVLIVIFVEVFANRPQKGNKV